MVVPIGSVGDGSYGDPPHGGLHQETSDYHIVDDGLPPCLCNVHGVGAYAGDKPVGAMVRSRRGK